MSKFTSFMDMNSGGGRKEDFQYCYIEAPREEAELIFYNRFGHNPSRVTCTCCGEDYSVSESDSLEEATGYQRGCEYKDGKYLEEAGRGKYIPIEEYVKQDNLLIIRESDISNDERGGDMPEQGYVWQD